MWRSSGCASCAGSVRISSRKRSSDPSYASRRRRAAGEPEERPDRDLEDAPARVAREAVEEVGAQHRGHYGSVAAARLSRHAAEAVRVVAFVDERDDLLAEIGVVTAAPIRVDELG